MAAREGWTVVSDTSYPGYTGIPRDVMQGYELMAAEVYDALPEPRTHVFIQTGVGGLVTAQAKRRWGARRPTIILADPELSACWADSFRAGRPVAVKGDLNTLMAGLACGEVSLLAWEVLVDHADFAIAVQDQEAVEMMRFLARPDGDPPIVAGESAVAGLAALKLALADAAAREAIELGSDARVLVFGTEGDTDPEPHRDLVGAHADAVRRRVA